MPSGGSRAAVGEAASYLPAPDVRLLRVGGRALLHAGGAQALYELNETAARLWARLAAGAGCAEAAAELEALGLAADAARDFARSAARAWTLGGQLIPTAVLIAIESAPDAVRTLQVEDSSVELAFHGGADAAACDAVFRQFYGPLAGPARRLAAVAHEGLLHLSLDGAQLAVVEPAGLAPELKAALTDLVLQAVSGAFLTHGAWLVRGDRGLVLSGAPGAGKTTLTAALAAAGWRYGGDDILRVEPDGRARGVPFAAAMKRGAWPLLAPSVPGLAELPVWRRGDGQEVRYALPSALAPREPRPIGAVVLLDRQADASASLTALHPVEALTALLDSAWSPERRLDGEALAGLAGALEQAGCWRLTYSDLAEAVAAVDGLGDG
jgi:hypothetical protein